ncbi:CsxC family protein [Clostridium sp. WILCCON 0269]|uniref:CsxC family protein n=1 Tax=Candidatus Clostridium eludens TaxID=3381663 RepID=A0ABW8SR47_9CLOT
MDYNDSSKSSDSCSTVTATSKPLTEQTCVAPDVIAAGDVFVKSPVILAEANVTLPVEATITLDQAVIEVKRIKKNVFLTEARLIPFSQDDRGFRSRTGIVFIEGFIRKNIEYATQTCRSGLSANVCGDIRHCTVEVPFNFTTRVAFFRQPVFNENTTPSELEFFNDKLKSCDICADNVIGRNPCDQSFSFTEFFNEKPYVELVKADIAEIDIHLNPMSNCQFPTRQRFTQLTEKIVVNLTFKLLQKQEIRLAALEPANPCFFGE